MPHLNKTRANIKKSLDNNALDTGTSPLIVHSANLSGEIDHVCWVPAVAIR